MAAPKRSIFEDQEVYASFETLLRQFNTTFVSLKTFRLPDMFRPTIKGENGTNVRLSVDQVNTQTSITSWRSDRNRVDIYMWITFWSLLAAQLPLGSNAFPDRRHTYPLFDSAFFRASGLDPELWALRPQLNGQPRTKHLLADITCLTQFGNDDYKIVTPPDLVDISEMLRLARGL